MKVNYFMKRLWVVWHGGLDYQSCLICWHWTIQVWIFQIFTIELCSWNEKQDCALMAYHDCIFIPLPSPFEVIPLIEVCGRFYDTFSKAIEAIGTHCSTKGWVENLVHSKSCYSSNLTCRGRLGRSLCFTQNMTSF